MSKTPEQTAYIPKASHAQVSLERTRLRSDAVSTDIPCLNFDLQEFWFLHSQVFPDSVAPYLIAYSDELLLKALRSGFLLMSQLAGVYFDKSHLRQYFSDPEWDYIGEAINDWHETRSTQTVEDWEDGSDDDDLIGAIGWK